jgi:hypothetical protein
MPRMNEGTRVLVGLGVGLAGGLMIAASHNPTLLHAGRARGAGRAVVGERDPDDGHTAGGSRS